MQKNSSDNEKEVLVDPLHLEVSGKSNSVFDDPEWQKVFGVDHNMFLPVKQNVGQKIQQATGIGGNIYQIICHSRIGN